MRTQMKRLSKPSKSAHRKRTRASRKDAAKPKTRGRSAITPIPVWSGARTGDLHASPLFLQMSGAEVGQLIRTKGWAFKDAAMLLGVSRQRLYQVEKQKRPALLWVLAALALPEQTPRLVNLAEDLVVQKAGARGNIPQPPREIITRHAGYELGEVLVAAEYVGEDVGEGDRCVIVSIYRQQNFWKFDLRSDRGLATFGTTDLDDFFVKVGEKIDLSQEDQP